jgi:hypothetical protein
VEKDSLDRQESRTILDGVPQSRALEACWLVLSGQKLVFWAAIEARARGYAESHSPPLEVIKSQAMIHLPFCPPPLRLQGVL